MINPKIIVKDNFVEPSICNNIKKELESLSDHYFVNRGKEDINYGLEGEAGNYLCVYEDSMPVALREKLKNLAPELNDMQLEHVMINKYHKGQFIPKHIDRNGPVLGLAMLLLDNKENVFRYNEDDGTEIEVPDEIGRYVIFNDLWVKHEVKPIEHGDRFIVLFFYM
jgi:hypothetical protein